MMMMLGEMVAVGNNDCDVRQTETTRYGMRETT